MTDKQRSIIEEYALLEQNTPGTITGLEDIRRRKEENSEPINFGPEKQNKEEENVEIKAEQKPGLLTRLKNAIFD